MRTYVCPIVGDGSGDSPFRAKVSDLGATYVSAAIGSELSGANRGRPRHSWTIAYCDTDDWLRIDDDTECVQVIETSNLDDFDLEPSQERRDKAADAAKDDEVRDASSFRGLVAHLLHRQYPGADAERFIEGAAGHRRISGGASLESFVSDAFTDTDGTLLENHSPDTGGSWEKLDFVLQVPGAFSDNAEVRSNQLQSVGDSLGLGYRNAAIPSSVEYTLTIQKHTGDAGQQQNLTALAGRVSSSGTASSAVDYYAFNAGYYDNASGAEIIKRVSDSETQLASTNPVSAGLSTNTTVEMVFDIKDAKKEGSITGVFTIDTTDNDITQTGRVGIGSAANNQNSWQDDFKAEQAVAAIARLPNIHNIPSVPGVG